MILMKLKYCVDLKCFSGDFFTFTELNSNADEIGILPTFGGEKIEFFLDRFMEFSKNI